MLHQNPEAAKGSKWKGLSSELGCLVEIVGEQLPQNLLFTMKARECVRREIRLQQFLLWVHENTSVNKYLSSLH